MTTLVILMPLWVSIIATGSKLFITLTLAGIVLYLLFKPKKRIGDSMSLKKTLQKAVSQSHDVKIDKLKATILDYLQQEAKEGLSYALISVMTSAQEEWDGHPSFAKAFRTILSMEDFKTLVLKSFEREGLKLECTQVGEADINVKFYWGD